MKRWRIKRLDEWPGRSGPRNWASDMNEFAGCEITEEEYQKIHKDGSWCKYWFGILCSIHPYHLIEVDENDFQLGDKVYCTSGTSMNGHEFTIISIDSHFISLCSSTWMDGHSCNSLRTEIPVFNLKGCWNANKDKITKINKNDKNEVSRQDQRGQPRGTTISIPRKTVKIASGSRPIGCRTASRRVGESARAGSIKHNLVQSY